MRATVPVKLKNAGFHPMPKPINWDISHKVAAMVGAKVAHCAENASRALLNHESELPSGTRYVEGAWLPNPNLDAEPHAWLETPDYMIDPTADVYGAVAVYVRVADFSRERVAAHVAESEGKLQPILVDDPRVNHALCLLDEPHARHTRSGKDCGCRKMTRDQVAEPFTPDDYLRSL